MKHNKLTKFALLLWLATLAVFVFFFVRGNVAPGSDNRTAVVLAASERDLILSEMRALLSGVHGILDALNHNNMRQTASAARSVGMAAAADVNPALMSKLPMPFKQLGMSVHHDMDNLAQAADSGKPVAELQTMLADTMTKCVACHAAWQLQSNQP